MAITRNNSLSGMVGPVVVYMLNGKNIMRARPSRFKQTKATKAAAKQFGLASGISANLRRQIYRSLEGMTQQSMRYRFNKAILEWLRSGRPATNSGMPGFSSLEQFQFNEKISLRDRLRAQVSIDWSRAGKIILDIPAMVPNRDIAAPQNTASIQWIIEVARTSLKNQLSVEGIPPTAAFNIKYSGKTINSRRIEIPFVLKPGELTIVVVALRYIINNNPGVLNDEKWMPTGIIGTYYTDK